MKDIIVTVEKTTRNARKMQYWQVTFGDSSTAQVIRSQFGEWYLDGVRVLDTDEIKQLQAAIAKAVRTFK